ncbi:hypothetical protein SB822_02015 [Paraburkholderia sp. SIMBA_054]
MASTSTRFTGCRGVDQVNIRLHFGSFLCKPVQVRSDDPVVGVVEVTRETYERAFEWRSSAILRCRKRQPLTGITSCQESGPSHRQTPVAILDEKQVAGRVDGCPPDHVLLLLV